MPFAPRARAHTAPPPSWGPQPNQYRRREGQPPVAVGGGGRYGDPAADSAEESPEVVAQFFADATGEEQERQRALREEYRPAPPLAL